MVSESTWRTERVERNTGAAIARERQDGVQDSLRYHAARPREIPARLAELDREWDVERAITANAAAFTLAGLALTALLDRRFIAVPAMVGGFLLQHAVQGWCPPGDAAAPARVSHAGRDLRGTLRPQDARRPVSLVRRPRPGAMVGNGGFHSRRRRGLNRPRRAPEWHGARAPRSAVPDLFRHRQIGEIRVAERPLEFDAGHVEQHHPLPRVLADMPGRALEHLVQLLRAVIGLHDLLRRFVRRLPPPRIDLGAHPAAVIGERGGAGHVGRVGGRDRQRLAEKFAAGDLDERFRDAEHVVRQHAYLRGRFGTSMSSLSSGISGTSPIAASIKRVIRSTSWAGDSTGPVFSLSLRNSTTCAMFCAKTNSSPRDSTGIERAPRRCNSARPGGSSRILIDWNSIPRTERNSLSLRQLVQPGCQNAFNGAVSGIARVLSEAASWR